MYEKLLKQYFWVEAQENSDRSEHQEMELSKDEHYANTMLVDM